MEQAENIIQQIENVLDKMRPFLQRDGGNIVLDHFDEKTGIVYVRMIGACEGCLLASTDISEGVEVILLDEVPGVSGVELINAKPEFKQLSDKKYLDDDPNNPDNKKKEEK